jgi:hypothetical protein
MPRIDKESVISAQIHSERPLTPALSRSDGEREVEDRVRGRFGSGSAGLGTARPTPTDNLWLQFPAA